MLNGTSERNFIEQECPIIEHRSHFIDYFFFDEIRTRHLGSLISRNMKFFLWLFPFLYCMTLFAQDTNKDIILFQGYILAEDSLPVENAYLINYRNLKINATDSTGYFSTFLQEGDSLMINHLSLKPKVIHANKNKATDNKIYIPIRMHMIKLVSVNELRFQREMKYAQNNINNLYKELERRGLRTNTSYSQTAPFRMMIGGPMSGISLDVLNIFQLSRENRLDNAHKKKKYIKKQMEMDSINCMLRRKEKLDGILPE